MHHANAIQMLQLNLGMLVLYVCIIYANVCVYGIFYRAICCHRTIQITSSLHEAFMKTNINTMPLMIFGRIQFVYAFRKCLCYMYMLMGLYIYMYMSILILKVFAYILLPVPKMYASSSAAGGLLANGSVTQLRPELQWRHVAHRTGRNACWINEICVHVLKRDNETRTTNRHKQNSKQTEKTSLKTSSTKMTTTTKKMWLTECGAILLYCTRTRHYGAAAVPNVVPVDVAARHHALEERIQLSFRRTGGCFVQFSQGVRRISLQWSCKWCICRRW